MNLNTTLQIQAELSALGDIWLNETVSTTDATPTTVYTYAITANQPVQIEVNCTAMRETSGAFLAKRSKTFFYDGTTVHEGGWWATLTDQRLGTGVDNCDFDIVVTGTDIDIIWTGEAADMTAEFKYIIHKMQSSTLLP